MNKFTRHLAQFIALPAPQQRTLFAVALGLPVMSAALWWWGLAGLQARLKDAGSDAGRRMSENDIRALGQLIATAARHIPFPSTCLTRSLLFNWMLRRRGVPSELRIGIRMENSALRAHAWVEVAGVPVNDEPDVARRFAAFTDLAPGSPAPRYD